MYSGSTSWRILEYNECEERGFFSGIQIGNKIIYLKSPYAGEVLFVLLDPERQDTMEDKGTSLSPREFEFLLEVVFTETEREYINRGIWRLSS